MEWKAEAPVAFVLLQLLNGLASAAALFLVASGLSLIFGVTRVVNFAHGALYMLGAYLALDLVPWVGFWPALPLAALGVALFGAVVERLILRRIYGAPELFALLATFGVALMVEDGVVLIWGPDDRLGPQAPGLSGAVTLFGQPFPAYDLFLILLGPLVLGALWLLFQRTRFGILVRAATQDREMVSALGVDQRRLFSLVFVLGAGLAGLGGALQLPRETVHHAMDLSAVVQAFVVTVIGGMGSLAGAWWAAVLIGVVNAFGLALVPQASLVLPFVLMAMVLVARPHGLLGRPPARPDTAPAVHAAAAPLRPFTRMERLLAGLVMAGLTLGAILGGPWGRDLLSETLILGLSTAGLQFLTGLGGLVSFGHAAFFGLGAYAAALVHTATPLGMSGALVAGPLAGGLLGAAFGPLCARLGGVYLAMLTLALAQSLHALATQWLAVTHGDNGILGVWPNGWAGTPTGFLLLVAGLTLVTVLGLRRLAFAPFGLALRAAREAPVRVETLGVPVTAARTGAFAVAGAVAGLAGGLWVHLKGSVFPEVLGVGTSVDALVMLLLGGIATMMGPFLGAGVFKGLQVWVSGWTDYWQLVLGAVVLLLVVLLPDGLVGSAGRLRRALHRRQLALGRWRARRRGQQA